MNSNEEFYSISINFEPDLLEPETEWFLTSDFKSSVGKLSLSEFKGNVDFIKPANLAQSISRKRPLITAVSANTKSKASNSVKNLAETVNGTFVQKPADFIEAIQSLETGKKTFTCKFCGVQNQDKGNLGRHVLTKHLSDVVVIKCTLCEYSAKLKGNMKTHYMSKHKLPESLAISAVNG